MSAIGKSLINRMKINSVHRNMNCVWEIAEQVVAGRNQSAIISGPSGIGKNFAFETVFAEHGIPWVPQRPRSPAALVRQIHANNYPGYVHIFDECDYMVLNPDFLGVLKIVTDPKNTDRWISNDTSNPKTSVSPFKVVCSFVFLCNTNLYLPKWCNSLRIGPHITALNDRCLPFVMSFDRMEIYEYTVYLVVVEKMLKNSGFSREVSELALEYFYQHMDRLRDVSPRGIRQIANQIELSPTGWQTFLETRLLPESICSRPHWRPTLAPMSKHASSAPPRSTATVAKPTPIRRPMAPRRPVGVIQSPSPIRGPMPPQRPMGSPPWAPPRLAWDRDSGGPITPT